MADGTIYGFQENFNVCVIDCVDSNQWHDTLDLWKTFSSEKKKYILKNYLFLFNLEEGIEPYYTLRVMEKLVQFGCRVHSQAFISQSLKLYFDKKYPNNRFTTATIQENFHLGMRNGIANQGLTFNYKKTLETKRKYRIKYFSFRHTPARNDAYLWIKSNGWLLEPNNMFVRRKRDHGENTQNIYEYRKYNKHIHVTDALQKWLDDYVIIHSDEIGRDVIDNNSQDDGLYEAHQNSYFDILTETIHPLQTHPLEIARNITSLSKRSFFPLACRNAFHIYPENKPLENLLKSLGFELFFKSDEDFIKNSNADFYKTEEVQRKLQNNQDKIMMHLKRNWWL